MTAVFLTPLVHHTSKADVCGGVAPAGRTGRAGRTGVCVTLVGRNKEGLIPFIEKKAGVKFERTGAPQPADMAKVAGTDQLPNMHVASLLTCSHKRGRAHKKQRTSSTKWHGCTKQGEHSQSSIHQLQSDMVAQSRSIPHRAAYIIFKVTVTK